MLEYNLLFNHNRIKKQKRNKAIKNVLKFNSNTTSFDFNEFQTLLNVFMNPIKYTNSKLQYDISYNKEFIFSDKLLIILLEILFYKKLIIDDDPVKYEFVKIKKTIQTEYLRYFLLNDCKKDKKIIKDKFNFDLSRKHYRKIIEFKQYKENENLISKCYGDINSFLKNCDLKGESVISNVSELIIELIDNGLDHGDNDVLVDIDITENYNKKGCQGNYYGINIVVLNLSKKLLWEDVKNKLLNDKEDKNIAKLRNLQNKHKEYFDDCYTFDRFCLISSFQHGISGRRGENSTGGTGLTKLIECIQESSEAYNCYVITGNDCLLFEHEYLKPKDDKWVGFNYENDYELPPDKKVFLSTPLYFSGTAYNLSFVFKKEDGND